jgi:NADH-quinone oxidoreductase subunit M
LATLSCRGPWLLIVLLIAGTVPPYLELRARHRPTRGFAVYMGLFAVLLVVGQALVQFEGTGRLHSLWALLPLLTAVLIRSGMVPMHGWMNDLFENATFGTALLFCAPQVGAYAAVRLVLPIAETSVLRSLGAVSLVTAVYAAGLALVQRDARSFFSYLFLSSSSLVLVGLEVVTPIGLTGALCVWLSVGLSLGAFGLTLRALEARRDHLSLTEFQGLYEHTPALAVSFFLTGLASVGFPGTLGFIGTELLIDGAVTVFPYIGVALVMASALNGIAFVKAYFLLFTGKRHTSTVSLAIGLRERLAVLTVAAIIVAGGLMPRFTVGSRHAAAEDLLRSRPATLDDRSVAERDTEAALIH